MPEIITSLKQFINRKLLLKEMPTGSMSRYSNVTIGVHYLITDVEGSNFWLLDNENNSISFSYERFDLDSSTYFVYRDESVNKLIISKGKLDNFIEIYNCPFNILNVELIFSLTKMFCIGYMVGCEQNKPINDINEFL